MKIGDRVRTPRFSNVKISAVFDSKAAAYENGYTEPTHYNDGSYTILGKAKDMYRMVFAAVPLN